MKIIISEKGKLELDRLKFDIMNSINNIIRYIPDIDTIGVSHISVTDLPSDKKSRKNKAGASYIEKYEKHPAYIEMYLKNLFSHIRNAETFLLMRPIQEFGLAKTIYHEFGHHVRRLRTHGIKKSESEVYAELYAETIMSTYISDNSSYIDACFDELENIADDRILSIKIVNQMRAGWENFLSESNKKARRLR